VKAWDALAGTFAQDRWASIDQRCALARDGPSAELDAALPSGLCAAKLHHAPK